jgi:hypothetical protein
VVTPGGGGGGGGGDRRMNQRIGYRLVAEQLSRVPFDTLFTGGCCPFLSFQFEDNN